MKTTSRAHLIRYTTVLLSLIALFLVNICSAVFAAESWKEDFDEVCGQVMGAESMTEKELTAMMQKADKILPLIQASDDPGKKVYLTRLKKCRAVYQFMIEAKQTPAK